MALQAQCSSSLCLCRRWILALNGAVFSLVMALQTFSCVLWLGRRCILAYSGSVGAVF